MLTQVQEAQAEKAAKPSESSLANCPSSYSWPQQNNSRGTSQPQHRNMAAVSSPETFLGVLNTCCPEGNGARSPGTERGQQISLRDFFSHARSYPGGCRLNEGPSRENAPVCNDQEPASMLFPEPREGQGKAAAGGQGRPSGRAGTGQQSPTTQADKRHAMSISATAREVRVPMQIDGGSVVADSGRAAAIPAGEGPGKASAPALLQLPCDGDESQLRNICVSKDSFQHPHCLAHCCSGTARQRMAGSG